jgi:DNA polymerase-3 subunit epsilon
VLQFIGGSPILAFHAWFDKIMLARHLAIADLPALPNPWIDIEKLCIAVHPKSSAESLDDWLACYDISCAARHEAAADTYAECELLQRIWPALAKDAKNWKELKAIEAYGRVLRDV